MAIHALHAFLPLVCISSLCCQSKKSLNIKPFQMKKLLILTIAAGLAFTSCKKDNETKEKVFVGPVTKFQHGTAWTWYEVDDNDKPLRIAVAIDDAAMNSLDTNHPGGSGHHHENAISLKFHPKAAGTPFEHFGLDWNPKGHEPEFIYGKPHFDFHFYMMGEAERLAIPPYDVDSSKFLLAPAPAYLPATYINPGGGVPQMGVHWIDVTSPELNGAPFTQTFIYGSYNNKVTFYEPMITEEFIKANTSFERSIPMPIKFQKTGYYPTKMKITKTGTVTNVSLEGFVLRSAS
jgi:hypothetical protein